MGKFTDVNEVYQDDEIIVPAAITEDIFHYAIHEKLGFQTGHHDALGNGDSIMISFKTPVESVCLLHMLTQFHGSGECRFKIHEAPTLSTDGTVHPVMNKWRATGTVPTKVLEHETDSPNWNTVGCEIDTTISADGTIINGGGEGEHIGDGRQNGGSLANEALEWVLKGDTIYTFELASESTSNECYIQLDWFEVPPST